MAKVTIKAVGTTYPKTKYIIEVNGKEFTRISKNPYTHALYISTPETEWAYATEKVSFHRSKDLAEKAQGQYPEGTVFQMIELTQDTQKPAQEVTFGKKEYGMIEASNGCLIVCKVFPVEKYIVKREGKELETFPTLRKAKAFVKSL